jgi:hypothetical protein
MEFIEQYVSQETLLAILGVVIAAQALAVAITKITKTPKDDEYVAVFYRVVFKLAALVGAKPKAQ